MKQYCRYCAFCFQADEDEFRCSDHPKGEEPHWTRKQYRPRGQYRKKTPGEIALKERQVSFL